MFNLFSRYRTGLMNAEGTPPAGGTIPANPPANPTPPTPPAAPAVVPGEEWRQMSPEAFKERLAREREAGEKATLKGLGVESVENGKAALAAAKAKADAEKTELQRAQDEAAALKPVAAKQAAQEAAIKRYLEAEEKLIPEDKRGLLELAPPADQPEARLDWITKAKLQGLFAVTAAPAAAGAPPPGGPPSGKPATTGAPPGPTQPAPVVTKSAWEEHQALRKINPMLAAQFAAKNGPAIEASRPK